MKIVLLVKPLGILTYLLAMSTIVSGLKRIELRYHHALAFTTIAIATLHGGLIVYLTFFVKQ